MSRLAVDNLAVERGGRRLISALTFELLSGDVLRLAGANGTGKSSLLRVLAGLLSASGGVLEVRGSRAYLGHENGFDLDRSLKNEVKFWTGKKELGPPPFDLAPLLSFQLRRLSQGQKRKAALWRTVESGADIWLLDEPGAGLDAAALAALRGLISAHARAGGIAVIATHRETEFEPTRTLELRGAST